MTLQTAEKYVHPVTKGPLLIDSAGNLYDSEDTDIILSENRSGTYDFASIAGESEEKEYYDDSYSKDSFKALTIEDCQKYWRKNPALRRLLMTMGDISGKRILLLGNGTSLKEFLFLTLGARCVYTDISLRAVEYAKIMFRRSEFEQRGFNKIEFHAIDACHLPFPDESFDIIYGCVFVHHVEDLDKLFSEISRCLKAGGICRFLDTAYSPLWQCLKKTVLKPLQSYVHRKQPISPADVVATRRGGYRHEHLTRIKDAYGFREMLYWQFAFFEYLLDRATIKLGGRSLRKLMPVMQALDTLLDKLSGIVRKHGIWLVWGFTR